LDAELTTRSRRLCAQLQAVLTVKAGGIATARIWVIFVQIVIAGLQSWWTYNTVPTDLSVGVMEVRGGIVDEGSGSVTR
jgi:hypothetical protein